MAFQDNSGTIILDAVLTDIGRKKMTQGRFRVTHFGLGDDEIDYSLAIMPDETGYDGEFKLTANPPILEAFAGQYTNIQYGLLDLPRNDILYLPQIALNTKLENAVRNPANLGKRVHLATNLETAKKLKSDIGARKFLQNDSLLTNVLLVESGIERVSGSPLGRTKIAQERYLLNLGLMDKYYFVYCDSRLISHIYQNAPDAYFKNDAKNNFYTNMQPLVKIIKNSIGALVDNYETYNCTGMNNEIYNLPGSDGNDIALSAFRGPRGTALALNFKLADRLVNSSTSQSDDRFAVFGTLNTALFGGSNMYDYIDTSIMIEGSSSGKQLLVPIRIVRYRTT